MLELAIVSNSKSGMFYFVDLPLVINLYISKTSSFNSGLEEWKSFFSLTSSLDDSLSFIFNSAADCFGDLAYLVALLISSSASHYASN